MSLQGSAGGPSGWGPTGLALLLCLRLASCASCASASSSPSPSNLSLCVHICPYCCDSVYRELSCALSLSAALPSSVCVYVLTSTHTHTHTHTHGQMFPVLDSTEEATGETLKRSLN